jgi:hypothetical protein
VGAPLEEVLRTGAFAEHRSSRASGPIGVAPPLRAKDCPEFGSLLGVVDLVSICRPSELPRDLRGHESVNRRPGNWCWVLANPRRLAKPIRATGQARLFYFEIADALVPM